MTGWNWWQGNVFIPITKCNDSTNNISDQLIPLEGFIDESYDRIKQNVIDKKLTDQLYKIRKSKHKEFVSIQKEKDQTKRLVKNKRNINLDLPQKENLKNENKNQSNSIICGDSILNGVDGDGISTKKNRTIVRCFPGATSDDMKDFVKPLAKKKPDKMILHVGTNDIFKEINTIENLSIILAEIRKESPNTEIFVSNLCIRQDKPNVSKYINDLNNRLKHFCDLNNIENISHENIDSTCLSKRKLHLNQKGTKRLALNFKEFIESKQFWSLNAQNHIDGDVTENLKHLKNKNPENILLSYINVNSIRYKFDDLVTFLDSSIDILNIAETKLDYSFPLVNFL